MANVPLTLEVLTEAVAGNAVAIRRIARLQPAGGPGDKVFPPTYEGGTYAFEDRVIDGQRIPCVLLDSVQSQANRMELALLDANRAGKIRIPLIAVDFGTAELPEVGTITSLDAPHRIADAILRDSLNGGVPFRDSKEGRLLDSASASNATDLFGLCPTALLFGLWDSTGPLGGMGTKFQRAIVGELIGVGIQAGVQPSSRIDPLGIQLNAGKVYATEDGGWTLKEGEARKDKGKAVLYGKEGKPSEINHGNVTPSFKGNPGGVTMAYAIQTIVLSMPALRRLQFPLNAPSDPAAFAAARTVLAALGLSAAALMIEQGCDLRSRCLLVPEPEQPPRWEIIRSDGTFDGFDLDGEGACALLVGALERARSLGLPWRQDPLTLTPSEGLATLVRRSRELAMQTSGER